ncbi:MAG: enoyl-CoA hydratase/isomerase family protein [Rhodospirillaceae bacterium]|jgi:enoyl-CoA hydratase/carnithine racemase|nr:enoyl-CoA hydratase/isomerase family protein [Rhodospirillaceae bacterium]MBT4688036.1 enoyl-CoA hydratase/isomerase family protein [Rhodospirillaceae bacterium]MBT5083326.1 enoyl-CoA hydratase/isomerase family protein [Rhodospirillaceae bacterium]MBT5526218.1 enoyl-CoA hydratase/isomerase family protein [Rhodospirillaceae bacterium]MBT5882300.1 enoyl-CoA hydratase/isomerase family protein [Rhodospirillaceae bacterium]
MSGEVLVERDGHVATVTLSAPDRLNAMNLAMWQGIADAFTVLDMVDDLRCIIMRGAGEKAFAAGADIAEFAKERFDRDSAQAYGAVMAEALEAIQNCRHPVVAMIHGACVGGGLELACCCDMRICGTASRFGVPVKNLGLVVALNEMQAVAAVVGRANALEIVLEGRIFDAQRAQQMGLVNRIVADDQVTAEVEATAQRIADGAPLVARWHKKFARRLSQPEALSAADIEESYDCFATEDFQTGYKAFLAKEKPEFQGR